MNKKYMIVAIVLMVVGFAAVSTSLFLNGSTNIIGKKDDFKVYYSDAKVNGVQDLSIVESETSLRFSTELDTLGQTYVIEYDVTNSSKNYDADLEMVCTGGDEYLSVVNSFDDVTNLAATETRVGTLTLTLAKTYTGADYDVDINCTITAKAVERTSLGTGTPESPVSGGVTTDTYYHIGDRIYFDMSEEFIVIDPSEDNFTLLAANAIDSTYMQTDIPDYVIFSDSAGWEYTPGPKEIDIQQYNGKVKTYINEYATYLNSLAYTTSIETDLITLEQLEKLDCVITDDYSNTSTLTCADSEYYDWLIIDDLWWTKSADSSVADHVWLVGHNGYKGRIDSHLYDAYVSSGGIKEGYGSVRPIIKIDYNELMNANKCERLTNGSSDCPADEF